MHRWIAAAAAIIAAGWVAAVIAGPLLPTPLAGLLYAAGSLICHQIPDRSFHLQSFQLPVCARCLGLYAGGAAGSIVAAVVVASHRNGFEAARVSSVARQSRQRIRLTFVAAIPTIATVLVERGVGIPVSNTMRAIAAVPLAAVVACMIVRALIPPERAA